MARRAKDTNQKLYRLMVSLPVSWREILDTINTKSHGEALRRLVRYALDNGGLDALKTGPVTARVMDPETQAQNAAIAAMIAADAARRAAPQPQPVYIDDDLTEADILAMGGTPTPAPTYKSIIPPRGADGQPLTSPDPHHITDEQRALLAQRFDPNAPTGDVIEAFEGWND